MNPLFDFAGLDKTGYIRYVVKESNLNKDEVNCVDWGLKGMLTYRTHPFHEPCLLTAPSSGVKEGATQHIVHGLLF